MTCAAVGCLPACLLCCRAVVRLLRVLCCSRMCCAAAGCAVLRAQLWRCCDGMTLALALPDLALALTWPLLCCRCLTGASGRCRRGRPSMLLR
jgi:hypothetical protein